MAIMQGRSNFKDWATIVMCKLKRYGIVHHLACQERKCCGAINISNFYPDCLFTSHYHSVRSISNLCGGGIEMFYIIGGSSASQELDTKGSTNPLLWGCPVEWWMTQQPAYNFCPFAFSAASP